MHLKCHESLHQDSLNTTKPDDINAGILQTAFLNAFFFLIKNFTIFIQISLKLIPMCVQLTVYVCIG